MTNAANTSCPAGPCHLPGSDGRLFAETPGLDRMKDGRVPPGQRLSRAAPSDEWLIRASVTFPPERRYNPSRLDNGIRWLLGRLENER